MSELTSIERYELRTFANALETFISNISAHCAKMENGVAGCAGYMRDEKSQEALKNIADVCMDIRATLSPAQMLQDKVLEMLGIFDQTY